MQGYDAHGDLLVGYPNEDQTALLGYAVTISAQTTDGSKLPTFTTAAAAITTKPIGIITDGGYATGTGTSRVTTIATCSSGAKARLKADTGTPGTIVAGSEIVMSAATAGTVKLDPGSGARYTFAVALESASAGDLFLALLHTPMYFAS
jgi:hypothetical protein